METKCGMMISPKYCKDNYIKLDLNEQSGDEKWAKAIDIFKDRIKGRYLNQIELLSTDIKSNGFAIMALNCLLIEALYQFKNGIATSPRRKNREEYSDFLKQMDAETFGVDDVAERFYKNIRCGILHSAQTKGKSRLSDQEGFVAIVKAGILVVSVKGVTNLLNEYFNDYVQKLLNSNESELRSHFIKKMKNVCR